MELLVAIISTVRNHFLNSFLCKSRSRFIRLGKRRVDALLTEAIDAINYLEIDPVTTEEYAAYITFVDETQQNVDEMEAQLDYVKELYDTMEEFAFPIPSMDMANYLVTI